jgi:hypothetical protein
MLARYPRSLEFAVENRRFNATVLGAWCVKGTVVI